MVHVENRSRWIPSGILIGLGLIGGAVLFWFDPARNDFYPTCLFHKTTGLLCPGCGSLRAVHQLLHGNLSSAFHFNALLVISLPLLLWFSARFAFKTSRHEPFSCSLKWVWVLITAGILFGILRNLPLGPFALLRPPL
jgi:hypothetical protein